MRDKKQIVKEFYPESHSPLWKEVRVGNDCNSMCRANWEKLKKEDTEYRKGLDESGRQDSRRGFKYVGFQDSENFEDHHKRLREKAKENWSDVRKAKEEWRIDSLYSDGSGGKRPEDMALCAHKFSKFYKIDWDTMDKQLHHTIVTGFRENFTKFKHHGGDTETEFRDDKTNNFSVRYNEPLDAVINRFLDEHNAERLEYTIVSIEYSSGGWYGSGEGENNQASALVLFEVEER